MRSFTMILALLLTQILPFSAVLAKPRAYRAPTPTAAAAIVASRQHHAPRALLDVCAYIGVDLGLGIDLLGIPTSELLDLQICLCLSALPLTLDANAQVKALGDKYGMDLVNAVLSLLINTVPSSSHCTYPDNCTPSCEPANPCGWQCKPPFVPEGDKCVCPSHWVSCNGQCLPPGSTCGSAVPHAPYRRSLNHVEDAQASCKTNESVCGVYGGGKNAFECIDTTNDLESCGGCMVPNPFTASSAPAGRDCTAIEGAEDVSCTNSACVVSTCQSGYVVNASHDGCVASGTLKVQAKRHH